MPSHTFQSPTVPTSPTGGRWALVNGQIALPDEVVTGKVLLVEGGKILGIADAGDVGQDTPQVDMGGRLIAPGLVDIHTHGALGYTFSVPDGAAWDAICQENARRGVTSLLATTSTAPIADLVAVLEFARAWMSATAGEGAPDRGAQVLGVHLEGPYFALAQAGAQNPAYIRNPDDGTVDALLEHSDVIRMVSYAPELPGALALTERLARLGIVPAAGHSMAQDVDLEAVVAHGLRHVIHLWSGQSTTVREGPWRRPGLLEASLASDGLTAEIIADNRHLPATLMKLAVKCIPPERLCIVSDATSGAGLPDGSRFHMAGMEYEVRDGVGMMLDGSAFGGSATLLNQMVPVLLHVVGLPLPQALRMATLTPARVIGVDHCKGSLEPGKDADIAIFDDDFSAWRVMIGGAWHSDVPRSDVPR